MLVLFFLPSPPPSLSPQPAEFEWCQQCLPYGLWSCLKTKVLGISHPKRSCAAQLEGVQPFYCTSLDLSLDASQDVKDPGCFLFAGNIPFYMKWSRSKKKAWKDFFTTKEPISSGQTIHPGCGKLKFKPFACSRQRRHITDECPNQHSVSYFELRHWLCLHTIYQEVNYKENLQSFSCYLVSACVHVLTLW